MAQGKAAQVERPTDIQIVGANVYRLRVLRVPKWSQEDLHDVSGVATETIRKLEAARDGRPDPPGVQLSKLSKLAEAFGVGIAELFREDGGTRVFMQGNPPTLQVIDGARRKPRPERHQRPLIMYPVPDLKP